MDLATLIVFQDPFGSLNPRMSVAAMLGEPPKVHRLGGRTRREWGVELLGKVGLWAEHIDRYPHEFSGHQRQRRGIACALSVEPDFLAPDEPVSALDVSVQAQGINLLADLQSELGLTYLFCSRPGPRLARQRSGHSHVSRPHCGARGGDGPVP